MVLAEGGSGSGGAAGSPSSEQPKYRHHHPRHGGPGPSRLSRERDRDLDRISTTQGQGGRPDGRSVNTNGRLAPGSRGMGDDLGPLEPPMRGVSAEADARRGSAGGGEVQPASAGQNDGRPRKLIGDYKLTKTLGQGSMGKVKLAVHTVTGERRACKIIPRPLGAVPLKEHVVIGPTSSIRDLPAACEISSHPKPKRTDDTKETRIIREAAIMLLLDHPHIVRLHEVVMSRDYYYMFFELVNGGQMLDYIISHGKLREKSARKFIRQIVSAIDYCHQNSIVHRDLKIENILIDKTGGIKMIDFGLSNLYSPKSHLSTFCGSLYFAAPELLNAKAYIGPEIDVWSLGIILYVLVCGRVPFDDTSMPVLHAKIKAGVVEYPTHLSNECKHLISRMLVTQPSQRAGLREIKSHPWMTKGYDGEPDNYLPHREPLSLPLEKEVIESMKGFEFGPDELIAYELEQCVAQHQRVHENNGGAPESPLVSIYHLVQEKLDREERERVVAATRSFRNSITDSIVSIHRRSFGAPEAATPAPSDLHRRRLPAPTISMVTIRTALGRTRKEFRLRNGGTAFSAIKVAGDRGAIRRMRGKTAKYQPRQDRYGGDEDTAPYHLSLPRGRIVGNRRSRNREVMRQGGTDGSDPRPSADAAHPEPAYQPHDRRSLASVARFPFADGDRESRTSTSTYGTSVNTSNGALPGRSKSLTTLSFRPGRADEHIRSVVLKGLFSVVNTSTKSPTAMRDDLLRVLEEMGVLIAEWQGGFECEYVASVVGVTDAGEEERRRDGAGGNSGFWRFGKDRGDGGPSSSSADRRAWFSSRSSVGTNRHGDVASGPPSTVGSGRGLSMSSVYTGDSDLPPTPSSRRPSGVLTPNTPNTPSTPMSPMMPPPGVHFEVYIVKIPWLGLHGIQFRRISGDTWQYKKVCTMILDNVHL
ncbi:serine/threonine-protein kinase KIN2 [Borealophlyctis nickersoniae]|nr:serine/threonine-protein kinase KIN2 [Borealophlyctis nickersoniae]